MKGGGEGVKHLRNHKQSFHKPCGTFKTYSLYYGHIGRVELSVAVPIQRCSIIIQARSITTHKELNQLRLRLIPCIESENAMC